jgi:cephalosporin hydroxylase
MPSPETLPPPELPACPNDAAAIEAMAADEEIRSLRARLLSLMAKHRYAYNWTWDGRPIIQLPSDVMAMQMLILHHRPDLIIETGIAHGGALVFYASMLELIGAGRVVGIDREIRPHNRRALEAHPRFDRITLVEGSSTDDAVVERVTAMAGEAERVFVCLDSNHTAEHVAAELERYAPLVTPGGYLVVFDTVIEDMAVEDFPDRPWGPGNSPKTAVHAFLGEHPEFEIDRGLEQRLLVTVAPDGYLRRVE